MREIEASRWKLQSSSKSDRAEDLMKIGQVEGALKLCTSAIVEDPGNIDAYTVGALAWFQVKGGVQKSREWLKKSVDLLLMHDYARDISNYGDVLDNIRELGFYDLIPVFKDF